MKLTVKRSGKKARNKSFGELARDTKKMMFGAPKAKKTAKKKKAKAK
jgi:hypothetical protein